VAHSRISSDPLLDNWRRLHIQIGNVNVALAEWDVWLQNEGRPPEFRRNLPRPSVSLDALVELRELLLTRLQDLQDRFGDGPDLQEIEQPERFGTADRS
jgi:hypothetical protein